MNEQQPSELHSNSLETRNITAEAGELIGVGRFEIFNNFETGVILSHELSDGREVSFHLSPAEALNFAQVIDSKRNELQAAGVSAEQSMFTGAGRNI